MSERRNILNNDDNDDEDSHGQEPNLGVVFDQHIKHEFQEHDVETTMETMIEPYVHHVPMMTGGVGYADVYNFYKNHFMGKMPMTQRLCVSQGLLTKIRLLMRYPQFHSR